MTKLSVKNAAIASVWYTLGNILIKGINFISLPIFSRIMTTEEFGIYNVFLSYDAILFVIIGMALHSCVRSANFDFKGKIDEFISSISLIYIINLLILSGIVIFIPSLTTWLDFERKMLLMLVMYAFGSALITLYNNRIAIDYTYKKYIIVAALNSLGNVLLSLFFMTTIYKSEKALGRIVGATSITFLVGVFILFYFYNLAKPKINYYYWKYAISYSWPIIPHGISQVLLSQFDRIMIKQLVGVRAVGLYSLPGSLKMILIVIIESLSTAWNTWLYEALEKKEKKGIQEYAEKLTLIFIIITVGMLSISPEVIHLVGGIAYDESKFVAIPIILDAYVISMYNIVVPVEYYKKKTIFIMLGTMMAGLLNIVTNYIFIKEYGYVAAAYTTLFSYACYLSLHTFIAYKLIGFCVLPIKIMLSGIIIVVSVAAIDLLFINNFVLRWGICAVVLLPIIFKLFNSGMFNDILLKFRKKN